MSKIIDQAEAIKFRLDNDVAELSGVAVIVDRQKDLGEEIKKAVAKAKGAAVIISASSGRNNKPDDSGLELLTSFSVVVITKPIKRKGEPDAITIMEQIIISIHDFPLTLSTHCTRHAKVQGWKLINHSTYLIYEITLTTPTLLQ